MREQPGLRKASKKLDLGVVERSACCLNGFHSLELVAEVHVPDFLCVLPVADFGPCHEDRVTGCRQLEIANVGPGLL